MQYLHTYNSYKPQDTELKQQCLRTERIHINYNFIPNVKLLIQSPRS